MARIARDFWISEPRLTRWLKLANREDGLDDRPGGQRSDASRAPVTPAVVATADQRLKELEKRDRQFEQENEVLPAGAAKI